MSIEQQRVMIARFMGMEGTDAFLALNYMYEQSWNLLMPVVEKIESGSLRDVLIYDKVCRIEDPALGKKWMGAGRTKIEAVYEAVTEYLTTNSTTNEHTNKP